MLGSPQSELLHRLDAVYWVLLAVRHARGRGRELVLESVRYLLQLLANHLDPHLAAHEPARQWLHRAKRSGWHLEELDRLRADLLGQVILAEQARLAKEGHLPGGPLHSGHLVRGEAGCQLELDLD